MIRKITSQYVSKCFSFRHSYNCQRFSSKAGKVPKNPRTYDIIYDLEKDQYVDSIHEDGTTTSSDYNEENAEGDVDITNYQKKYVNKDKVSIFVKSILKHFGVEKYNVEIIFFDEVDMIEYFHDALDINRDAIDVFALPSFEAISPGNLQLSYDGFVITQSSGLGLILLCPSIMHKQLLKDQEQDLQSQDNQRDNQCVESKGVRNVMRTKFRLRDRIYMLLVEGVLELVGYKKDTQVDREIMVAKEEQLIEELAKDFPSISSVSKKVSKSSRRKKTEAVKATI